MYMVTTEEEIDEGQEEDIEVPKAMSDIFESVAGAVYLDANRDLDIVWRVFFNLMRKTIEECCAYPPRSPIRELMELEPGKTRFSKMERIIETGKVRVTVDIGNKMKFTGMGRNYRIAKTTAAKRALNSSCDVITALSYIADKEIVLPGIDCSNRDQIPQKHGRAEVTRS
ncbi:hypothetical protein DICVIV_11728 [Dictyocaulus viviparus]|uniref:RNase III domain-containing protein n=1 Tax=Dictyocaulus viviparus TaxID=29172 RepID=A0A0D8XEX0_DICVI|nr:hypothetical protein DICVIV_11728 [Dictyocaulus viviparus]